MKNSSVFDISKNHYTNITTIVYTKIILETIGTIQSISILLINTPLFALIFSRQSLRHKVTNKLFLHLQVIHMTIGAVHFISDYVKVSDYIVDNVLLISMFFSFSV